MRRIGLLLLLCCGLVFRAAAAPAPSVIALPDVPFVIPQPLAQVTTQLNDNARRGANTLETMLNPVNVAGGHFGMLRSTQVLGQVLPQILFVRNVEVQGAGVRNLLIVATAANMLYALDADNLSVVFQRQLAPVIPVGSKTQPVTINGATRQIKNSLIYPFA